MKKVLLLVFGLCILGVSSTCYALVNGGFELGNFTGWNVNISSGGSAQVVNSHAGSSLTYGPVEGSFFAELKPGAPGLPTSITQSFSATPLTKLAGWAAFDAKDYSPYIDSAQVNILENSTVIDTPWYADVASVGDNGDGPWTAWSWTAPKSGNFTVEFSVTNDKDSGYSSYALFDATKTEVIPEPTTLSLVAISLLGLLGIRKRK